MTYVGKCDEFFDMRIEMGSSKSNSKNFFGINGYKVLFEKKGNSNISHTISVSSFAMVV